jgi:radical SAM protein with 4Fe4S-binding SPASM domain
MVDSDESAIISPGGELGLCEHYQNSKFYGNINDPSMKDMEVIKGWRVKSQYTEICDDCPLKPICLKLRDCPDHKICSKWEKEYMLKRHSEDVKLIYNNWKEA